MRVAASSTTAALLFVLAGLHQGAAAQDRRSHWGVSAGLAPQWTASSTWVERLYDAGTIDLSGSDLRVGVVRGSDLGGDWGIAFVNRSLDDGGVYDDAAAADPTNGDGRRPGRYVTNGVTARGVEVHRFAPFGGAIADRVQIGLEFGAGVAVLDGFADLVDAESGGVIESVPVRTALALRGIDKLGVDGLLPLGRLELAVAAIFPLPQWCGGDLQPERNERDETNPDPDRGAVRSALCAAGGSARHRGPDGFRRAVQPEYRGVRDRCLYHQFLCGRAHCSRRRRGGVLQHVPGGKLNVRAGRRALFASAVGLDRPAGRPRRCGLRRGRDILHLRGGRRCRA